jgi:signal transduction histidine kinase
MFIRDNIPRVNDLPAAVFDKYELRIDEQTNISYIVEDSVRKDNVLLVAFDKNKTLYVANPVGNNITKYSVDSKKSEIYIFKNEYNYDSDTNPRFQLITIPYSDYRKITNNGKVRIYIDFGGGYDSREYDVNTSEYKSLGYVYPTK